MRRFRVWLGIASVVFLVGQSGCVPAPLNWSPDGKWLAYVTVERSTNGVLDTDWFFNSPDASTPDPRREMEKLGQPLVYRIWATRSDNSGSAKIDESPYPMTSPSWNARGTALAYGKIEKNDIGGQEFQIVIQDGPTSRRVLCRQSFSEIKPEYSQITSTAPAWSPDGKYLAVPSIKPAGLAIVRGDTGRIVKSLADATLPSWSPDGTKLAFIRSGEPEALYCLDAGFDSPRKLTEVGPIGQAPTWSRDGVHIMTVRGMAQPSDGQPRYKSTLVRVNAETGVFDLVRNLENNRYGVDPILPEVSAVFDRDGDNLFFTAANSGLSSIIIWIQTRNNGVRDQFAPLHLSVPIGPLAIQPQGELMALRLGVGTGPGPIALMEPISHKLTPIAPDVPSRLEWIRLLVAVSRHVLSRHAPDGMAKLAPIGRPTSLILPGETTPTSEIANFLRRVGRLGGPLCELGSDVSLDPSKQRVFTQAKLYFAYLRQDFETVVETIDEIEPTLTSRDERLRLLGLRAQIDLLKGDTTNAGIAVDYLRSVVRPKNTRFERTARGPVLTKEDEMVPDWTKSLAYRLETAVKPSAEPPADTTDHTNFDAPQPGLGLDPPPDVFVPGRRRRFMQEIPQELFRER